MIEFQDKCLAFQTRDKVIGMWITPNSLSIILCPQERK